MNYSNNILTRKNMRIIVSFFALVAMVMPCMSQQLNYSVSGT